MMKKFFLIICILLFSQGIIFSQYKIYVSPALGIYLGNSENSIKIMGEKNYKLYFGFGIAFQKDNIFGQSLSVEYNYQKITKDNTLTFVYTGEAGPEPLGFFGVDVTLINHNIDLDYIGSLSKSFKFGIGPSLVITNRIIETDGVPSGAELLSHTLYDKLASAGLGANGFMEFILPFSESEKYFFFNSRIKLRYTHSVWFDEKGRNLDDYKQEFFTTEVSMGLGYSF